MQRMSDRYEDAKSAARANRDFYRAFERLDYPAMRALWLEDPRIKCVHPGGEILSGPDRVHASWRAIFESTVSIHFEIADLSIDVVGDLACTAQIERIRSSPDDDELLSETAATNLYQRSDGAWKMILHHASPIARRFFNV